MKQEYENTELKAQNYAQCEIAFEQIKWSY